MFRHKDGGGGGVDQRLAAVGRDGFAQFLCPASRINLGSRPLTCCIFYPLASVIDLFLRCDLPGVPNSGSLLAGCRIASLGSYRVSWRGVMISDGEQMSLRGLSQRRAPPLALTPFLEGAVWGPRRRGRQSTLVPASASSTSRTKRLIDIILAAIGIVAFLPLLLLVALLIRLESPGPIIYRQKRGGLMGAPFEIYKFRSMRVTDDGGIVKHATKNDPRLTSIGAFLRKSSFDELPQLFNILKGDMSIVGPRPHALRHDELYAAEIPAYRGRMSARPGLTGLAQVSGYRGDIPNIEAMADRVACDLEYIANWSIMLDLKLIALTLARFPFDPHAY